MSYLGHPSTFAPLLDVIGVVRDPQDAESSRELLLGVRQMLGDRYREETAGDEDGPFRIVFARDRIRGALHGADGHKGLLRLRVIAVAQGACPDFLEAVDLAIAEARRAHDLAPERITQERESEKPDAHHADWTRAKVADPDLVELLDMSDVT